MSKEYKKVINCFNKYLEWSDSLPKSNELIELEKKLINHFNGTSILNGDNFIKINSKIISTYAINERESKYFKLYWKLVISTINIKFNVDIKNIKPINKYNKLVLDVLENIKKHYPKNKIVRIQYNEILSLYTIILGTENIKELPIRVMYDNNWKEIHKQITSITRIKKQKMILQIQKLILKENT